MFPKEKWKYAYTYCIYNVYILRVCVCVLGVQKSLGLLFKRLLSNSFLSDFRYMRL